MTITERVNAVKEKYAEDTELHDLLDQLESLASVNKIVRRPKQDVHEDRGDGLVDILVWYQINHSTETGRLIVRRHRDILSADDAVNLEERIYAYLVSRNATRHDMSASDIMITNYRTFPAKQE